MSAGWSRKISDWIVVSHRTSLATQATPAETHLAFGPTILYRKVILSLQMEPEYHYPQANVPHRTVKCFSRVTRTPANVASGTGKLGS